MPRVCFLRIKAREEVTKISDKKQHITLGSLFDGIGGFPYAASFFGIKTLWASEIMPQAISVTKRHLPDMEHVGDITKLDGGKLPPVDIISFGSPCQGLSAAGKRLGLADPRSGLFSEAIRIINEMREATNGEYPKFALWENVPGAMHTGGGLDFKAVLEAFTETEVPVPKSTKWANAGMVRGGRAHIAWCVYNAQYFGCAQRRRRIFLVADFAGERSEEILFIPQSLCRYFEAGGTPWQGAPANAFRGTDGRIEILNDQERLKDISAQSAFLPKAKIMSGSSLNIEKDGQSPTLRSQTHGNLPVVVKTVDLPSLRDHGANEGAVGVHQGYDGNISTASTAYTLTTSSTASARNAPLVAHLGCIGEQQRYVATSPKISGTLCASASGLNRPGGMGSETDLCIVIPIQDKATRCSGGGETRNNDGAGNGLGVGKDGDPAPTITSGDRHAVATYCLQGSMVGRQDCNGPCGSGVNNDLSFTLNTVDRHAVAQPFSMQRSDEYKENDIASTQAARQYKSPTDLICSAVDCQNQIHRKFIVRRLTPTECERLQGFPDGWTEFDVDDKPISDTRRYQMLGNSVAVPCVAYIMQGIAQAFTT